MTARRLTDLTSYTGILPYASELFGVYQSLIGWRSKRTLRRLREAVYDARFAALDHLARRFASLVDVQFNVDGYAEVRLLEPGVLAGDRPRAQGTRLLRALAARLPVEPPSPAGWRELIHPDLLKMLLHEEVLPWHRDEALRFAQELSRGEAGEPGDREGRIRNAIEANQAAHVAALGRESKVAGVLLEAVAHGQHGFLAELFYGGRSLDDPRAAFQGALDHATAGFRDPFLDFDPRRDVADVSLSPIGVVHLFRQFFFELDTFLGSPTGHVWLSPGSTVELLEVSSRRVLTEKTVETTLESTLRAERSETLRDELSEAVKDENKNDLKLGLSTTANQSWGTGNVTATASLDLDKTQQTARETTHKRMREQSEKLSTELRQSYKTTFRTVTEVTDTSSTRHVLTNTSTALVNYELRRKMRQVAVQVQDVGSFLCWSSFVDEPGLALGLANLVHVASPADLVPIPDQALTPMPADKLVPFTTAATWNFGDNRKYNDPQLGFVYLTNYQLPAPPEGYELKRTDRVEIKVVSHAGEDAENQLYAFAGKLRPDGGSIDVGVVTGPGGLEWDQRIDFVVGGVLVYVVSAARRAEIERANAARLAAGKAADEQNQRQQREAFHKAARERIELASRIRPRPYEDLRAEERMIVFRRLISSLMTQLDYQWADDRTRHTLAELINAIFDVDKMLYFVAPEWWKPRRRAHLVFGETELSRLSGDALINWSDGAARDDSYLITERSEPAPMGASLGWLLQLDGDGYRNAFLNAPWVKAVLPIRPGKEQAAIAWLQHAQVEGTDGLDAAYVAPPAELAEIRAGLLAVDPGDPVGTRADVTVGDALRHLCLVVARKHAESTRVAAYPNGSEVRDDDKVASTPVAKVYEHGFYPLQGGFRFDPRSPDPSSPDRNFQVFDQWIEVVPTDQVVPVAVSYDPKTGRQV